MYNRELKPRTDRLCRKLHIIMIKSVKLTNFGPIADFSFNGFKGINLIIGSNGSGKTFLLKSLYIAQKSIETFGRGRNIDPFKDLLFNKLYWTFQADRLGDLVRVPNKGHLTFHMKEYNGGEINYSFSPAAERQIVNVENTCKPRATNSVFIPAKEVLSLMETVIHDREMRQVFSFDETYYDLAKALTPTTSGKLSQEFLHARGQLESAIHGHIVYSKKKKAWVFTEANSNAEFSIQVTSEGTKKIAILDTLIGNHYLSKKSVVFIDEPEAGLHPQLLVEFLDIISVLSEYGVQFFIASHSYFVIKKLYLIAQEQRIDIPVISFTKDGYECSNLKDDMPDNPIIRQSVDLYRQEVCL